MKTIIHYFLTLLLLTTQTIHAKKAAAVSKTTTTTTTLKPNEPRELSSGEMAAAGAFATAFGVTLVHPIDTIKTLQQSSEGMGLNMLQATNKIMKNGGFPALYSGLGPYVTSDGCAGALKFARLVFFFMEVFLIDWNKFLLFWACFFLLISSTVIYSCTIIFDEIIKL